VSITIPLLVEGGLKAAYKRDWTDRRDLNLFIMALKGTRFKEEK